MYQRILLCTDGSEAARIAGEYAIWLANKLGASLTALHITDVRLLEGPLLSDLAGAFGAQPYSALLPKLQQIQKEKADAILQAVDERCTEAGVNCTLLHDSGTLVPVFVEHEQNADLIVLGQRGEHAQWAWETLGSSVERMVRASRKPCLVCPEKFVEPDRLLVAYDGSDESTKALRASIQLAERLPRPITVMTVYETDAERDTAAKVIEQARLLAASRKLTVDLKIVHGKAEEQILRTAHEVHATLIVMGAYGHTRIRAMILGSTTSHVMRHTDLPVLLTRS